MANGKLHIVIFPWSAFGHILPFLELSKSLAKRCHHISFISTPRNIQRLPKLPLQIADLIDFIPLPLPRVEGLSETAEATSDLPPAQVQYLKKAFDGLEEPFRKFIQEASPKPDCIIQDFAQHWVPHIADAAGVPTIWLSICMASSLVFFGSISELGEARSRKMAEQFAVPPPWIPFPSKLCFRLHEARKLFVENLESNVSGISDISRIRVSLEGCKAVAIRSCMEVEPEWLRLLPQLYSKPVIPVGLLPPPAPEERGETEAAGDVIKRWLDKQRSSRSVVYIAFGSEATLSTEMVGELALGLELAKLPFLWALRRPSNATDETQWLPEGFEERTRGYGFISKGWVPQLKILAHESVGGFLMHSGWSSIIESLQFGHPLILLPIFGDHGISSRVIVEKGIAVEIERDEEDGSFTREAVATALRLVMMEKEGESFRSRAKELREVFSNKYCHEKYVDGLIDFLQNH